MEQEEKQRSTGIPSLDAQVEAIKKMPKRILPRIRELPRDFPGCKIKAPPNDASTVFAVGAGWYFPAAATALVAAGAKIVAYEMDEKKLARGQMGNIVTDEIFEFAAAHKESALMPKFTENQLARLPSVLKEIQNDHGYQRLRKKHESIAAIWSDASLNGWAEKVKKYESLNDSQKISKFELVAVKETIIEILQEANVLHIVHEEVTIDMMQSWLEAKKPVFMNSGAQVNLQRMGLDGFDSSVDGFVKEYLPDSSETTNDSETAKDSETTKDPETKEESETTRAIKKIINQKTKFIESGSKGDLPSVAFIGGGPSAMSSALDFLDKVKPNNLQVVWISPEEKPPHIPRKIMQIHNDNGKQMKYDWVPGYIRDLDFNNKKRIQSVEVFDLIEHKERKIQCDLLVHTYNENDFYGSDTETIVDFRDHITSMLDEKTPDNGLVRDAAVCIMRDTSDLQFRINDNWTASLEEDEVLLKELDDLVQRQDRQNYTGNLVVNGNNAMTSRVMLLAAMRGYRGHYYQISVPTDGPKLFESLEDQLKDRREKCIWHDFKGRVVKEGTFYREQKFSLGIIDKHGAPVSNVPQVDAVINGAGKTKITPLIEAMEQKGYISGLEDDDLHAKHSTLFGGTAFFGGLSHQEVEFPSVTLEPTTKGADFTKPWGWLDIFDTTLRLLTSNLEG